MRLLRIGLVVGLLAAASACDNDDSASTTATPAATSVANTEPSTTEPQVTAVTEPVAPSTVDSATTAASDPPTTTAPTTTPATTDSPTLIDVKVYFLRGERLAIAHRQIPGPATLRGALTELLAGPSGDEVSAGLQSAIPVGTELLDVNLRDELATIDLSDDYDDGGGTLSMTARVAQVVFTATQFDNSDRVLFWLQGEPIEFLGGEGLVLDEPLARMNVERAVTGGVIIDTPAPGSTVSSPFTVTGEGDVFEADFPIVVRRDGVQIAGPFLGFAGAWGDWDDFEVTIDLDAAPGPIEVVALDGHGCTPGDAECPANGEIVLPLILTE